jgi:hypothetical protein
MNPKLQENGYLLLDNFISPEEAANFYAQFKELYRIYPHEFQFRPQVPNSPGLSDPWIFLELMLQKLPIMSDLVGEQLFPTYCYGRHYKNGAVLLKHTDREACEIGVSLHLGGDVDNWGLFFESPNKKVNEVALKPGQAVVYLGCETPHWRNEFTGQEYGQVFLHYVRARGKYRWAYFDKNIREFQ